MRLNALMSLIWWAAQPAAAAPAPAAAAEPLKISWSKELKLSSLAAIDEALAQPLDDPFDVILPDRSVRKLKTCKDLLAVSKVKYDLPPDHQSDVDWDAVTSTSIRCGALEALKAAKPASISYLGWFHFTQAGVARLPPNFAMSIAEDDEDLMFYRYAKLNEGQASSEAIVVVTQTSPKACPKVIRTIP